MAFSPDGQRIVSGGEDGAVRLWGLDGSPIGSPFQGHAGGVNSVAFSPDGKRIVSGGEDRTVRLWGLDGDPIGQPFQGHIGEVYSVAFSPDGQRIVSGGGDGAIRLWRSSWESWLQVACRRLQDHPLLTQPETVIADKDFRVVALGAREACDRRVWSQEAVSRRPALRWERIVGLLAGEFEPVGSTPRLVAYRRTGS